MERDLWKWKRYEFNIRTPSYDNGLCSSLRIWKEKHQQKSLNV